MNRQQKEIDRLLESTFDYSVAAMQAAELPPGWWPVYRELLIRLRGVSAPSRNSLFIPCPGPGPSGDLEFALTDEDAVVQGLLRKTSKRLSHTCQSCGRRGQLRRITLLRRAPFCSTCWAPQALDQELELLESWVAGKGLRPTALASDRFATDPDAIAELDMPPLVRCVLPEQVWRSLSSCGADGQRQLSRFVTKSDLKQLLPALRGQLPGSA